MKCRAVFAVAALLFFFAGFGPAQDRKALPSDVSSAEAQPAIFPAVVARVNGEPVSGRELETLVRRELSAIGNPEWKKLRGEYRSQLTLANLTSLINSKLIHQKAAAVGVKVTQEELKAELKKIAGAYKSEKEMNEALARENLDRATFEKNVYRNLATSRYVEDTVNKKIVVTPEEIAGHYSSNPEEFRHPDIVRTSLILIPSSADAPDQDAAAKRRAEDLLARIRKGEDFARIARENSADVSASRGGDVGYASREGLPGEYSALAFALPVGEMSIIKTQLGYQIIKVTDRKKEGSFTLEEVRRQIEEQVKARKTQEKMNSLVNQLRETANIEILISASELLNP